MVDPTGVNREDELASTRDAVLVVRLVVDRQARLHYGELLDAEAVSQGRFSSLNGLLGAVSRWLDAQRRHGSDNGETEPGTPPAPG
jgi:hypothetical protein